MVTNTFSPAVQALAARVPDYVARAIQVAAVEIESDTKRALTSAQPYPAVNTGQLRASYRIVIQPGRMAARVGSDLQHSKFVEHGTGPHWAPIAPLLYWAKRKFGKEGERIAYAVQQAIARRGTAARPALGPAFERARKTLAAKLKRAVREALK